MAANIEFVDSVPRWLFQKTLSENDLDKLYLSRGNLLNLYPAALAPDSPNTFELVIYDSHKTRWPMTLKKTTHDRWHLRGEWRKFASEWNFIKGREIHFFEYTCNTEATFLLIASHRELFQFHL